MLNILCPFDLLLVCQVLGVQVVDAQCHSSVDAGEGALNRCGPQFLTLGILRPFFSFLFGTEEQMLSPR